MNTSFLTQCPATKPDENLQSYLVSRIHKEQFNVARVATAYATVSGVRALLAAFEEHGLKKSYWLIGLDDAITQPGAIELLLSLDDAEVRVVSYEDINYRFHPKFFSFTKQPAQENQLTVIGSANLTASALRGNAEAVAILESLNNQDRASIDAVWVSLWEQGHEPKAPELCAYKSRYEKASALNKGYKKFIKKPKKKENSVEVFASDEAELDPSVAGTCWIECGNITAMGRELEFKAEQGLFFGLSPSGGPPKLIEFRTSNGNKTNLRMKYQGNHMWRLQMNNSVPEVKNGLRPANKDGKLGRSTYIAVFKRNIDEPLFDIRFIKIDGKEFLKLRKKTAEMGTLGKTTARQYGWC